MKKFEIRPDCWVDDSGCMNGDLEAYESELGTWVDVADIPKIKADAIRDYGYKAIFPSMGDGFSGDYVCGYEQALADMVSHANKLEQDE